MVFLRILKSHRHYSLLRHHTTSPTLPTSLKRDSKLLSPYSSFQTRFSTSTQLDVVVEEPSKPDWAPSENVDLGIGKKPLHVLFRSAIGISENQECSDCSDDEFVEEGGKSTEIEEVTKKLRRLERDVKRLKGNSKVEEKAEIESSPSKPKSLYSLFAKGSVSEGDRSSSKQMKMESSCDVKGFTGFSPEMASLVGVLHEKGYLKNANFLRSKHLNLSCFSTYYSLSFLRAAAEKFGEDRQEIAKSWWESTQTFEEVSVAFHRGRYLFKGLGRSWIKPIETFIEISIGVRYLSRDHLIRITLFGCPSTERRTAFAAKRLRAFYDIKEDIVCGPCKLRSSCKVANQTVGGKIHDLHVKDVIRILVRYALEKVDIPDDVKSSVEKLLNEVINLSKQLHPSSD
ncbi:hypothetical protein Sjap_026198 [Stephania japonica]|uniref:Uncharacterized protein n=1 Tax=Stephania japonica TaxID=461633 RepID=A0AAP0E7I7_9MAGN